MFCSQCGKAISDGDAFCMYCGRPVSPVVGKSAGPEQSAPHYSTGATADPADTWRKKAGTWQKTGKPFVPKKEKPLWKTYAAILVVVVLVSVLLFAGWLYSLGRYERKAEALVTDYICDYCAERGETVKEIRPDLFLEPGNLGGYAVGYSMDGYITLEGGPDEEYFFSASFDFDSGVSSGRVTGIKIIRVSW